ncbi:MAG TPA: ATP-binding cassette domain-containing protein [Acidobacteriota bacterium]|nr:ATP-binding cassette domain-containing protein [Acidobacteriota bacterium]
MDLVLVQAPGRSEERIIPLATGINILGSGPESHIQISSPRIRSHHLNIEPTEEGLSITSLQSDSPFKYGENLCHKALLRNGETFSIDGIEFQCKRIPATERTELGLARKFIPQKSDIQTTAQPPKLSDMQVSGYVTQKSLNRFPVLIGRNEACDVVLNHPQVSGMHARLEKNYGVVYLEDLRSSNGTYVNDRLIHRTPLTTGESVLIMPYMLLFTGEFLNIYTLQQQSQLIGWQISVSAGEKKIIDRATLTCNSNELVGLIGPSGSGKTTLMKCLSGQVLPSTGKVQLNGLDVFTHFDIFKQNIGFVPQDDIIHRELTVEQTLYYAAKLRLPRDMSEKERRIRVKETLIELELEEQERLPVHRLSGGQRKRVNIAIELLTKPGILFLDEPTSGLDPALDEKLMLLFKKLSQDGRITILTTHLLEHAMIFSRIVLMHSGRLIYFGSPQEAINFFQVNSLSALYSRIKNRAAEEWQEEFQKTETHRKDVDVARDRILPSKRKSSESIERPPETASNQIHQGITLAKRYLEIILRDRKNTGLLLAQAPLITFFIFIATDNLSSRLFMMALAALWFGCNNAAREICKELPLYRRERMVNLGIVPYLFSKFVVLSVLLAMQCVVLAVLTPENFLDAYWPLLLCGIAGVSLGLLVSSIVNSPDKAIALVPILLIPQVLFSGIFGELKGTQRVFGEVMISKWSYNLLKKQFELPSMEVKKDLEGSIDESQQRMENSQERIDSLQRELDDILDRMGNIVDFVELNTLRYDADRISNDLKREQEAMEDARNEMERSEKRLRNNARLFVWIDHPDSEIIDQIILFLFTIILLIGSGIALKQKDYQLKIL